MTAPPNGAQTIVVNGKNRGYVIRPPKPNDPNKPNPVIFAFHGFQQTGNQMNPNSGPPNNFKAVFGSTGTMVYPTALPNQNGDNSWARDINDDLDFFDAMLATFESQMCVNANMVLALGHSNGAVFANVIGCRRGNVVRGFAPVEGGLGTTSNCPAPPPAFLVHGDLDIWSASAPASRSATTGSRPTAAPPPTPCRSIPPPASVTRAASSHPWCGASTRRPPTTAPATAGRRGPRWGCGRSSRDCEPPATAPLTFGQAVSGPLPGLLA